VPLVRSSLVTANSWSKLRKLRMLASAVIWCTMTSGWAGADRVEHTLAVEAVDDGRRRAGRLFRLARHWPASGWCR